MAASTLQRTIQVLTDATATLDSRRQALTSFRRLHLDGQRGTTLLKDEEICKLCNALIITSISEDDRLRIEACRTLDVVLPESKTANFDFFLTVLQMSRKKRLKILGTLSILKDETVVLISNALSIVNFLNDCLTSIQPTSMSWLLPENADNVTLLKSVESKNLNENKEFEEKVVDVSLYFLCRLCTFASLGLNVNQFDVFIMEKVLPLAFMGHSKQRKPALMVLQKAIRADLGPRMRSNHREIWDKFKCTLQSVYCKRMTILVNTSNQDWATQWETSITLIGTDLHKGSGLVNSLLKVEELAFKSADPNRRQAFLSWKLLIDNFALDQRELATMRRIKLLCVPLNAKNSKTEMMVLTKMEVWWHLIYKIYPSLGECVDCVLTPFLTLCLGPFGEKPLLLYKSDSAISLGKKFLKTQIFAIDAFAQLILSTENQAKIKVSVVKEKLPNPVNSSIFESLYKIFIHSFGEIIVILGLLPEEESKTRLNLSTMLWNTLIVRIEEYDKMKVTMYKELMSVVIELMKSPLTKMEVIQDFLTTVALKNFDNIALKTHLTEHTLTEVLQAFLQMDNYSCFTAEHFKSAEMLIWHLIKPKNSNVYYPRTTELMLSILNILDNSGKNNICNRNATVQIWCSIAKIVTKFIEDSQNFNEGTAIKHNFNTVEKIISFPFSADFIEDPVQLKYIVETWKDLYKQFDFQTELIVTVKPNEILNKTSNMMILSLEKNDRCCDFAILCTDTLLSSVNYDSLPRDEDVPEFIQLLKELISQSFQKKSLLIEKILKIFSTFLLRISNHSMEKTNFYLKYFQPVVRNMLDKAHNNKLEQEISNTWNTIVILFKKFEKSLSYELLNVYRETILSAALHANVEISTVALSIFDLKDCVDQRSKAVLVDLTNEIEKSSTCKNGNISDNSIKIIKEKDHQTKPIGSFMNRRTESPSTSKHTVLGGKENISKNKVNYIEPDSQDFVAINSEVKLDASRLTDHQKEMFKKRRDDIPALYNELSVSHSQDTQELQQWFDAKLGKSSPVKSMEKVSNNNDTCKTPSSTFKNIMQTLSIERSKCNAQSIVDPKKAAANEKPAETPAASTIEDSEKKDEAAPVVAKKLDFDSREEFPADPEQTSPSIIDNAKMRRRNANDEVNGSGIGQDANGRMTRSTGQPQQSKLHKSLSTEQLATRGKKRRNSESNSESVLHVEREKRPRRDVTPDNLNSSDDSVKSNENKSSDSSKGEEEGKKVVTKRQLNEMSRLKIDMRFEPLPNRRSVCKSSDLTNDKKINADKHKEEKNCMLKETTNNKKRHSLKSTFIEKEDKLTSINKPTRKSLPGKIQQNSSSNVSSKKKVENVDETLEEIIIEDVTTQVEPVNKSCEVVEIVKATQDDSSITEIKSSQDSDIVESSQEPTFNSKMEKVECFIKIKKMEVVQSVRNPEEKSEKMDKTEKAEKTTNTENTENTENVENVEKVEKVESIENVKNTESVENRENNTEISENSEKAVKVIQCTSNDHEDSTIPVTAETEKSSTCQPENNKKLESNSAKFSSIVNQISSPKSTKPRGIIRSNYFPIQGRAAQMLGLVTKQSLNEKLAADSLKGAETALTDEVSIVPIAKKDRTPKESERVASPSTGGSRQEKMFSNMNNSLKTPERCASPAMTMFCNLKNDGERISPKLDKNDKNERETDVDRETFQMETATGEESPNGKIRKELPLLEWSNANPPSLTASPSASILKRNQEVDVETPNRKKRVSFADPPVSREMGYEIMTESSSPPKLEKLPTSRSPVIRKEPKKHTKLRLIQIEQDRLENESVQVNSTDKSNHLIVIEESANNLTDTVIVEASQKTSLSKVMSEIRDESEIVEAINNINSVTQSQDGDMFTDNNNASKNESIETIKTSTQNDQSNSSIKLDSIDLSNILHKSDDNQHISLEDTVDVANISSSIESIQNDKLSKTGSQQCTDPGDTLPVTDSVFSNLPNSQETQSGIARLNEAENLDSTLPVYPSLISCEDGVETVSGDLVDPLFTNHLANHFTKNSIRSVGDLAQLTERDINRLPIKSPKISCVKKALSRFQERMTNAPKTPERRTSNVVSSSTPLGNKHYSNSQSKESSFDDLMKSAGSSNSDLNSISALYEGKRNSKRRWTDNSMQTSPKKIKKNDEESCTNYMDLCDDEFLFNVFVKRFDAEKILKGYQEKMKNKSEKELKKETLNKLGLSVVDDSEASFEASTKTVGLQKVLQQLPKIFDSDSEFYDTVFKTYNKKFKTESMLDSLGVNEVKQILTNRFSSTELLNILAKKITKDDHVSDTNDLRSVLNKVPANVMIDNIRSRKDLNSSESLLKVLLDNTPDGLSDVVKSTIVESLTNKLDACELVDMYNDAVKAGIRKLQTK